MKNITVTAALLITFTLSVMGASPASGKDGVKEKIRKEITFPDFAKETNGNDFVLIGFTLDSVGSIEVSGINTSNPALGEYVAKKIQEITFDEEVDTPGEYAFRIDFELM